MPNATNPGCRLCGAIVETRPYGPGGVEVCFPCGMIDEAEAERRFTATLEKPVTVIRRKPPTQAVGEA